ncbi:MAG TPA: signal recognition particle-docking protein FtsY [Rhodospirillaceae bacterium]|nr:signal recognition particle-docking protein FtsY [Rhodospirillaceae bacterium]
MTNKTGWLARLKTGLTQSSNKLSDGITGLFTKRRLDAAALEELEELLITADLGPQTAARLVAEFGKNRFGKDISEQEVKEALAAQITAILEPCALPLVRGVGKKPYVILMVGVNGTGKTTTIGKMASLFRSQNLKVLMVAGDTFRAAAVSQLQVWAERADCEVLVGADGGDAAALAYQGLEIAKAEDFDVLLIDTAGRLHNKADLMQELSKISRVLKKLDTEAPHATLLVLDATTGQNAHTQVEVFRDLTTVTGLVVTKLDGSAKGGVLVALADRFKMPIHAIGVGEGVEDLQPFDATDFARSLMGLDV